jgi:hypothetical protein
MISEQTRTSAWALRPQQSIARQGAITALALFTPLFAVLYFLTIPAGTWLPVLTAQVLLLCVCAVAALAFFGTAIWVTPSGITTKNPRGVVHTLHRSQIGAVLVANVYQGLTLTTQPHLFIVDTDGRRLLGMRAPMWTAEDMAAVSSVLDVPLTTIFESATTKDIRTSHPHLLHWLERRPLVTVGLSGAAVLVPVGITVVVAMFFGLHPGAVG